MVSVNGKFADLLGVYRPAEAMDGAQVRPVTFETELPTAPVQLPRATSPGPYQGTLSVPRAQAATQPTEREAAIDAAVRAVQRSTAALESLSLWLRNDPRVAKAALDFSPAAWALLGPDARSNPEVRVHAAQRGVIASELAVDGTLQEHVRLLGNSGVRLREVLRSTLLDPEEALKLVAHDHRIDAVTFGWQDRPDWLDDEHWQARAAQANPLFLMGLGAERRERIFQIDAGLRQVYDKYRAEAASIGVSDDNFNRFRNPGEWHEVVRNRLEPLNDERPIALVVAASRDDTGGLVTGFDIARLSEQFRVMYFEVSNNDEAARAFESLGSHQAAFVQLTGHGSRGNLAWGDADPMTRARSIEPGRSWSLTAEADLAGRGLERYVRPGAAVYVDSCYAAEGGVHGNNIASAVQRVFADARVIASEEASDSSGPRFDSDGNALAHNVSASRPAYNERLFDGNVQRRTQPVSEPEEARVLAVRYITEAMSEANAGRLYGAELAERMRPQLTYAERVFRLNVRPSLYALWDEALAARLAERPPKSQPG